MIRLLGTDGQVKEATPEEPSKLRAVKPPTTTKGPGEGRTAEAHKDAPLDTHRATPRQPQVSHRSQCGGLPQRKHWEIIKCSEEQHKRT